MTEVSSTRVHRPAGKSLTVRLIRLSIVTVALGLLAYRLAVSDMGPSGLGPLLAGLVVLLVIFMVVLVLVLARARTEVGPDGIRNRVIGAQVHLPWDQLADVKVTTRGHMRTVQVARRDGRQVGLTALRDAPTMPDPQFDETVEVIRRQIADHGDGQGPDQPGSGA